MTPQPAPSGHLRDRHAVLIGGGGFLGSHLCERLLALGATVTVIDNFVTGLRSNLGHLCDAPGFRLCTRDATEALDLPGPVDFVLHLASPAAPLDYQRLPMPTLKAGAYATHQALRLARARGARMLLTSTSEVYGDPTVHPQPESYWGNVNPVGPRAVYDEAKRFAEIMTVTYAREHGVSAGIARIFNVYGPRMRPGDGRVVPTFIAQALRGEPLTVHGDGSQTRSLCYVADMVDGLLALLTHQVLGPVNLGHPRETSVVQLARLVQDAVGRHPGIRWQPRPVDDPTTRCPDIRLARRLLGWAPRVPLEDGLARTVAWFRQQPTTEPDLTATAAVRMAP